MDTKDSIKERIAEICAGGWFDAPDQIHKEYMVWFREAIERLKPLSDEGIRFSCLGEGGYYVGERCETATENPPVLMPQFRRVSQAQLDDIKRQLFEIIEGK